MDELDCRILRELQYNFPLSERPYETMAARLQISSEELWHRVQTMLADGVIRRLGASLDSHKLGFCSTLAAVSVEPDCVEHAAEIIARFPEVTHSYLRRDHFNIWFTIVATDDQKIGRILKQIRAALSLDNSQVLNLSMVRLFKLDTRFNVTP